MSEILSTIAERAEEIVEEFALFDDWLGKYEHLIELGKALPLIDDAYKNDRYRIRGCQSQVWLRAEVVEGHVLLTADSDALITKGLIALLVRVLNGQKREDVANADLSFLDRVGMNEHLSSNRKNGLEAMVKQIRKLANAEGDPHAISVQEAGAVDNAVLEEKIVDAIRTIYDPEIPVNVYDLGLIYEINIFPDRSVHVVMTLTSPNCPAAGILPGQVENKVANMEEVSDARVEMTFEPPYTMEMMSDEAKLELGFL